MTAETSNARGDLPSRDESRAATEQGLFRKFDVRRTDGSDAPGGKHHGCEYFVLDMTHDPHAKAAAAAYADSAQATHPQLATDMRDRYGLATPQPAAARGDVRGLVDYDAGLLNDFGGGDVIWWQDYLRAEIERANEFWREQTEQALAAAQQQGQAVACRWPSCECPNGTAECPKRTAPPSAPVGVDSIEANDSADYIELCASRLESFGKRVMAETLRAIAAEHRALAQQPAAVDESFVERFCGRWFQLTGRSLDRPSVRACLTEALATQHQEPKS